MGKLINRIPGSRLLISSLPGLASRTHVESLCMPRDGKLDIKRHSLSILYMLYKDCTISVRCWKFETQLQ